MVDRCAALPETQIMRSQGRVTVPVPPGSGIDTVIDPANLQTREDNPTNSKNPTNPM